MNTIQKMKLIETVKHHPELYNKNHISFSDFSMKEATWEEIGEKLGIPEPKKKWATIRDKFVRIKRLKEHNKQTDYDEKWDLYNSMKFLENFCRRRRNKPKNSFKDEQHSFKHEDTDTMLDQGQDNFEYVTNDDEQSEHQMDFNVSILHQDMENNAFDELNHENSTSACSQKMKITSSKKIENFEDKYKVLLEKLCGTNKPKDDSENMLFMKMIAKKLDTLPIKKKNQMQNQILQLVNEALDESEYM